ncbi:MAG: histidine ammonia-lyase [Bdellovibrionota bacterium]
MESLKLGLKPLTLEEVRDVALHERRVELSPAAVKRIEKAHQFLQAQIKKGETLYGVNTGFGLMSNVKIPPADIEQLQYNLLRSHSCGVGPALGDQYVRAMLLLRAANLAIGHSGVSLELVEHILAVLNRGIIPLIPEQGSVGASGDLAPLSHLALVLIGEGRARYKGKLVNGAQALRNAGLKPIRLGPKEGLALINGTQFMAAIGTHTLLEAEHLCDVADLAGAMTIEALRGTETAFEPEIHAVRPHPGQILVAERMRKILLSGGGKSRIARSHEDCGKVQDPYSLRCIPQVHGASRDTLAFVRGVLEREINSVTDNPLVFPSEKKILSGGNFHGQIVAIAMDTLCIAAAELASISEQRIEKLINPATSDLPPFLIKQGGLNSGFMIVQVAAASIVSENKTLCHPASVDSIPTSADKEDHVSMGAWAARKAAKVVENTRRVLSMELLSGAQGIDLLRPLQSSEAIEKVHQLIRRKVPRMDADRSVSGDLEYIEGLIASYTIDLKI